MTAARARCWCGRPIPARHVPHGVVDCAEHDDRTSAPTPITADMTPAQVSGPLVGPAGGYVDRPLPLPAEAPPGQRPVQPVVGLTDRTARDMVRMRAAGTDHLDAQGSTTHARAACPTPAPAGRDFRPTTARPGDDGTRPSPDRVTTGPACRLCGGDGFLFHVYEGAVELDGPCPDCTTTRQEATAA